MRVGQGAVLVTGGLGCIGAWTVRELREDGTAVYRESTVAAP